MSYLALKNWGLDSRKYDHKERLIAIVIWLGCFVLVASSLALIDLIRVFEFQHHDVMLSDNPRLLLASIAVGGILLGMGVAWYYRSTQSTGNLYLISLCSASFFALILGTAIELMIQLLLAHVVAQQTSYSFMSYVSSYWQQNWPEYVMVVLSIIAILIVRSILERYRFDVQRDSEDTSGNLGSAQMAKAKDMKRYKLRGKIGSLIGKDAKGLIRSPKLTDRLILAYRGNGKTSSLLIPFILDYPEVNKMITDIKGELAAVTANKAKALGRQVFVIDPFHVLKTLGVDIETHSINPFDALIKATGLERDRLITALASSLSASSQTARSETELHFSESALIILEGLIDFYLTQFKEDLDKLNLVAFHDWWLTVANDAKGKIIKAMQRGSSKAQAASAQLMSAGANESGSMKTTVYRQLQWLRGSHVREIFLTNTVDLDAFVSGEADIYIVLPEDMIHAYSRLVRVIMALIKVKLTQAPVHKLKKDYCFVLDELGQFGYSPDVEQIINTMRSRGVKVWASFQTIGQLEAYHDEAVFKGMPIKHFLGSDDIKTLKWIQELGGKTTVLTENISRNHQPGQKNRKASQSESHSLSETATDLIHFNDIREMPDDEQYVFIKGMRTIRCKKVYYYTEPSYEGRYDINPIENRQVN